MIRNTATAQQARIAIIVAAGHNGVIGRAGDLPWRLPSDLAHFKRLTMGKPMIMGRRTFQSIGRPLPGRDSIIVTRDPSFKAEGCRIAADITQAIVIGQECAVARGTDEIMVIGGAEIYAACLPLAGRIYLTEVALSPEGDTQFPAIDRAEWQEVDRKTIPAGPGDAASMDFVILERRGSSGQTTQS